MYLCTYVLVEVEVHGRLHVVTNPSTQRISVWVSPKVCLNAFQDENNLMSELPGYSCHYTN